MRQDGGVTTLVFLHAHPDDEALLTSGTMARAAVEGHRVVLIVATDGSAGLASADYAGDLARHRRSEVEESARLLGVHRVVHLGFADSGLDASAPQGFASVPFDDAVTPVVQIVREEGADVLVGYDRSGGYGHPDHLRVHAAARAVRDLLAAQGGKVPRLYEATLPREPIAQAVRLAAATGLTPEEFDPQEFARAWTPRNQITHRVNVRAYIPQKRASMAAHASQASADDSTRTLAVLGKLPDAVFSRVLGTEYFVEVSESARAGSSHKP